MEFLTVMLEKNGEDHLDRCVNNEVLDTVKEERNTYKIKRNAIWNGHMLLRNGLPKQVIEPNTEG